jgi:hypothetical protein
MVRNETLPEGLGNSLEAPPPLPLPRSLAEFGTFVRHGIPVIAVVGNDAGWTQIAREQVKLLKDSLRVSARKASW